MESLYLFAIALPDEIKAAIAVGVLYLVRLLLAGRVSDEWLIELAGLITAFIIAVIELALGLVPMQFEMVVVAVLKLIAVLLGSVLVVNGYRLVRSSMLARGLRP